MKLVTSELMRQIDREAIKVRGIPGEELMENAGRGIAEKILNSVNLLSAEWRVAIFCGKGNNGGDGFVVGRYLQKAGHKIEIYYMGQDDKLPHDARLNFDRAVENKINLNEIDSVDKLPENLECDVIVDAIFGTGFEGAPRGLSKDIIEYVNRQKALVVSVDLPSGLNADNGQYEGAVVQADYTFTLALPKFGQYLSPVTPEFVVENLPNRKPDGHKGDFGKLMVLAGSIGLTGAAVMTGESALRCGCGLVKVACPRTVQPVLATKMTEEKRRPGSSRAWRSAKIVR